MSHCRVPPEPSVRARAWNERSLFHSIGRCVRVEERQRPHTPYTSTGVRYAFFTSSSSQEGEKKLRLRSSGVARNHQVRSTYKREEADSGPECRADRRDTLRPPGQSARVLGPFDCSDSERRIILHRFSMATTALVYPFSGSKFPDIRRIHA
ncbi:hypothetical protein EVAR_24406_1 [Eumeta japonica]|uniref:Uncharacterized protein n=1 Tax=Eumeta variegata TaxID=151549 RepID=A0A4C1VQV5_EUMVA|nr:hypothetical protein EVAR_24406_1 [Eumeta japonica]